MTRRSPARASVIREAWAAWRSGLVMPGVYVDTFDPRNAHIIHARRAWLKWAMPRHLRRAKGPLLP